MNDQKMTNRELFKATYAKALLEARTKYPELYAWPMSEFDNICARMNAAIDKGSFNIVTEF